MTNGPAPLDSSPSLDVRALHVDLSDGFRRHWHGGDAFRSMAYNALSMGFPEGEQSFIDAVREGLRLLPDTPDAVSLRETASQFIAQEATHRHLHGQYNAQLEGQGLDNGWQRRVTRRIAWGRAHGVGAMQLLAITAAYEHCTAVFADGTLRYPGWLDGADSRMQLLWRWHAAEETEHKAVAFDLYKALGGSYGRRVCWYLYALTLFAIDATWQTVSNLRRDGSLFKPGTWWSCMQFLLGRDGIFWRNTWPLLQYFRRDFHPNQDTHAQTARALAVRWLASHSEDFRVVRAG